MDAKELSSELEKISPKNGDIIFVNQESIDLDTVAQMISPSPDQDNVTFAAVHVPCGMSIKDVVFSMTREELLALANPQT